MTTKAVIDEFFAERTLAVVGASRTGKKFGNAVLRELGAKGYTVLPVNPNAAEIGGVACYKSVRDLPPDVGGVVIAVPPAETERVLEDVHQAGIGRVWIQQGAESEAAVRYCEEHDISEVHGECILMFAPGAMFMHRAHRFINGVFGKLPA